MDFWGSIVTFFNDTGWKILVAMCILIVGGVIVHFLAKGLKNLLYKTPIDNSVVAFFISIIKIILWVLILFAVTAVLELSTSSLIVCLSSIALAVGLALKDSLANLTNGIFIIYNKPFKRGDHVRIDGIEGLVQNIKLLATELVTFDNRKLIIPNSKFTTDSIVNYTAMPRRRMDMTFGVAYGSDMDLVQRVIEQTLENHPLILKNPKSSVFISSHGSSSVDWTIWTWVATDDYWTMWKAIPKLIYQAFEKEGISIPFNQVDIHFDKETTKGEAIKQLAQSIKEDSKKESSFKDKSEEKTVKSKKIATKKTKGDKNAKK